MNWTDKDVLKLIDEFKRHNCLWDPHDNDRKNRVKKVECYREIGYKLGTSAAEVKRKIHNVLQSYRGYRRKILVKNKEASDAGINDSYKINWFAFDALHEFMEFAYRPSEEAETLNDSDVDNNEKTHIYPTSGNMKKSGEASGINTDKDMEINEDLLKVANLKKQRIKQKRLLARKKLQQKRKQKTDGNPQVSVIYKDLHKTLLTKEKMKKENNECDAYAKLVSIKLKTMDEWSRRNAMYEMDNIMYRYLINNKPFPHLSVDLVESVTSTHLTKPGRTSSSTQTVPNFSPSACTILPQTSRTHINSSPISTSTPTLSSPESIILLPPEISIKSEYPPVSC